MVKLGSNQRENIVCFVSILVLERIFIYLE